MVDNLIPRYRSYSELSDEMRKALVKAGIADLEGGAAGRTFGEAMMNAVARLYDDMNEAMRNVHPSTAAGIWLDMIGQDVGIPRLGSSRVDTIDVQKFFVPRGTLGSYTGGKDVVLGPGVEVTTSTGSPTYQVVPFADGTGQYPIWSANQREILVRTLSLERGTAANVASGQLIVHNLPIADVRTTNVADILSGSNPESDESYRYRLMGYGLASQGSNELAIRQAALREADVDDVIIQPFTQGPGSVTVVVVPRKGAGTLGLASRVQSRVAPVLGVGERLFVRLARATTLSLALRVRSVSEPTAVAAEARTALLGYLGSIDAGGTFVVSMAEAMVQGIPRVNSVQLLAMNVGGSVMAPRDIVLDPDEIFIVETPVSGSIQVEVLA